MTNHSLALQEAHSRSTLICALKRGLFASAAVLATVSWSAPAAAQSTVGEVVVTATKWTTRVLETPGAISALTTGDLQNRAIAHVEDLQTYIPNLVVGKVQGNGQITIRGVGMPIPSGDAEQGVTTNLDGVYLVRPALALMAMGDLERIEVLRGPQGTLYGRNATGGAINYITAKPTNDFDAGVTVGYGRYENFQSKAYVSGPIVKDKVQGRLFAMYNNDAGSIKNPFLGNRMGGLKTTAFKGNLRFLPRDRVTVDLMGFYARDEGSYMVREIIARPPGAAGSFPLAAGTYDLSPRVEPQDTQSAGKRTAKGGIATTSIGVGPADLKSITAYIDHKRREFVDSDASTTTVGGRKLAENDLFERSKVFSEELTLTSRLADRVDLVLGVYYLNEHEMHDLVVNVLQGASRLPLYTNERSQNFAAYADAKISLTPKLRVLAGLRESWDRKKGVNANTRPPIGDYLARGITCAPASFGTPDQGAIGGAAYELRYKEMTPKLGVQYDVMPHVMTYAMYQKGYKVGGIGQNSCGDFFDPEKNTSYEVGIKGSFFDKRMTVELASFYYDYRNVQVQQIPPGPPASQYVNAPKAVAKGLEFSMIAYATDRLRLNAEGSLLDAHYVEFSDIDTFAGETVRRDLHGYKLDRAPKYTFGAGMEYTIETESPLFHEIVLRGEGAYNGGYFLRRFNKPFDKQKSYGLLNAFATVKFQNNLTARAFVKNITDTVYVVSTYDSSLTGTINGTYGPARTWGVELSARF